MNRALFDDVSLAQLRKRKSEKWAVYGPDVLPAWVAETDFSIPPAIRSALDEALDAGDTGYAWPGELPDAFAGFARAELNWPVKPDRVFQIPDVMAGVTQALLTFTPPGARVVVNPPVYAPFFEVIETAGRSILEAPLRRARSGRWEIDFDVLENRFAAGARAYVLCNPHNPVGTAWTQEELHRINELATRHNVFVIADEIHAPLVLPGNTFVPFLHAAGDAPCASVLSASKAWNIPGLKCGLLVAGSDDVASVFEQRFRAIPTDIDSRVGHLGVHASIAAFRNGRAWLHQLRAYLDANRTLLRQLLDEHIPAIRYRDPDATYLAWLDCSELDLKAEAAAHFLQHGRVALEPGTKYGASGENHVRLNFGTSRAILTEIVTRMREALIY